jgi:hypothetical protein
LIAFGKPYFVLSMADARQDALKGEDKFKGRKVQVRMLAVLLPNRMHVVTVVGTGIQQVRRLERKARLPRARGATRPKSWPSALPCRRARPLDALGIQVPWGQTKSGRSPA